MKTKYAYEHTLFLGVIGGWECFNMPTKERLGVVEYDTIGKEWVMTSVPFNILFNADCLADIRHFMGQLE